MARPFAAAASLACALLLSLASVAPSAFADPGLRIPDVDQKAPDPETVEPPDNNETTEEEFLEDLKPDEFEALRLSAGLDFLSRYSPDSGWKIGGGGRFQLDLGAEQNRNKGSFGVEAAFGVLAEPKKDGDADIVGSLKVGGGADLSKDGAVGIQAGITVVDRPAEYSIEFLRPAVGVRLRHGGTAGRTVFMLEPLSGTYDLALDTYGSVSGVAFYLDQNIGDILELGLGGRAAILWTNGGTWEDWVQSDYGTTYREIETEQNGLGYIFFAEARARFNLGENAYLLFDGSVRRQISDVTIRAKNEDYHGAAGEERTEDASSTSFKGITSVGVAW